MPVIKITTLNAINTQLDERMAELKRCLKKQAAPNALSNYVNRDELAATTGTPSDIRIAVADFKTILAELARLK